MRISYLGSGWFQVRRGTDQMTHVRPPKDVRARALRGARAEVAALAAASYWTHMEPSPTRKQRAAWDRLEAASKRRRSILEWCTLRGPDNDLLASASAEVDAAAAAYHAAWQAVA